MMRLCTRIAGRRGYNALTSGVLLGIFLAGTAPSSVVAQDVESATSVEATAEVESQGFFEIVLSGGPVGWGIMFLLFALSVTSFYLVIDQLITIRRTTLMPEGLAEQVQQLLAGGQVRDADEVCRSRPSFLSFVLVHGLSEVDGGWTAAEKALEDALAEQAARLLRKTEYLSVIGNIAPMVGLLGTVMGMIMAFQRVAVTQGSAGAADLAEGIYQALVTTVGGLIVAIPSLGAFAIFRNRVDQFVAEVAYLAQQVFVPLKRRSGKTVRSGKSPPAPPAR
ncbi:MAG: peptide transporter TolQ [Planctomycetaceae bacterium]|nr:peptide transporter TolQ [Planctomycetaceae bacterium]HAA68602.1 peptide transporter TolQ [Planctomycetaceae bacterium]